MNREPLAPILAALVGLLRERARECATAAQVERAWMLEMIANMTMRAAQLVEERRHAGEGTGETFPHAPRTADEHEACDGLNDRSWCGQAVRGHNAEKEPIRLDCTRRHNHKGRCIAGSTGEPEGPQIHAVYEESPAAPPVVPQPETRPMRARLWGMDEERSDGTRTVKFTMRNEDAKRLHDHRDVLVTLPADPAPPQPDTSINGKFIADALAQLRVWISAPDREAVRAALRQHATAPVASPPAPSAPTSPVRVTHGGALECTACGSYESRSDVSPIAFQLAHRHDGAAPSVRVEGVVASNHANRTCSRAGIASR